MRRSRTRSAHNSAACLSVSGWQPVGVFGSFHVAIQHNKVNKVCNRGARFKNQFYKQAQSGEQP